MLINSICDNNCKVETVMLEENLSLDFKFFITNIREEKKLIPVNGHSAINRLVPHQKEEALYNHSF